MTQDRANISTEHQPKGSAANPSDTLDRGSEDANAAYRAPHLQSGNAADQDPKPVDAGAKPSEGGGQAAENRGSRAPDAGSGGATGSGAGAGGGGGEEDYDSDPVGGGGAVRFGSADRPDRGGDAPIGGSH
ncbi:hypothetical protein [Sphingomonas sp. ID0503]|uniref:hypothetical protein n=1 Tax=Sphingomonas sp. ID0503 TaxID=3399691 RepID=UPI003AFA8594